MKVDDIRLLALEKAFELFSKTVRTSDPKEIVRYAEEFEKYLMGKSESDRED